MGRSCPSSIAVPSPRRSTVASATVGYAHVIDSNADALAYALAQLVFAHEEVPHHALLNMALTLPRSASTRRSPPSRPIPSASTRASAPTRTAATSSVPAGRFREIVAAVPAPLTLGRVRLDDGTARMGFLCEPVGVADAEDITPYGGWRSYRRATSAVTALP